VEDELGPSVNNHDRSPPPSSAPSIGRRGSARRLSAILSVGSTQQKWRGQVELWMARTRRAQLGMCPAVPTAGMNRTPNDQTYKAPKGGVIIAVAQPRAKKATDSARLHSRPCLCTRGSRSPECRSMPRESAASPSPGCRVAVRVSPQHQIGSFRSRVLCSIRIGRYSGCRKDAMRLTKDESLTRGDRGRGGISIPAIMAGRRWARTTVGGPSRPNKQSGPSNDSTTHSPEAGPDPHAVLDLLEAGKSGERDPALTEKRQAPHKTPRSSESSRLLLPSFVLPAGCLLRQRQLQVVVRAPTK
jgi:hypothetical protein